MTTIYTRAGKGSALTWTEGDANITNLNNAKIESVSQDTNPSLGGNLNVNTQSIVSTSNGNITLAPNGTGQVVLDGATWPKSSSGGGGTVNGSVTYSNGNPTNTLTLSVMSGFSPNDSIQFSGGGVTSLGLSSSTTYYVINLMPIAGTVQLATAPSGSAITITGTGSVSAVTYTITTSGGGGGTPTTGQVLTWGTSGALTWSTPSSGSTSLSGLTTDVMVSSPSNGQVLTYSTASNKWTNQAASSGIASVGADTNPSLGGNLTVMGYSIISASNGNISITPNGTGDIILDGQKWPQADGSANQVLKTNGSGQLSWTTPASGTVTSVAGTGTVNGLSLSGTVTSSGSLTLGGTLDLSSPPAIGGTTASTGTFTGLTAKGATNTPKLLLDGTAVSSTWQGQAGMGLKIAAATYTDTSSAAGTVPGTYIHSIYPQTLASTNTVTVTDAGVLYIASMAAGTNTTITNAYSIYAAQRIRASDFTGTIGATTSSTGKFTNLTTTGYYNEAVYTSGTTTGTITPDCANGTTQKITLTGNITFNAFANPVAGQSMTLIITNSSGGGLTLTSTMKFAGASKTLSTGASAIDIMTVFYDGSTYYASLAKGFA